MSFSIDGSDRNIVAPCSPRPKVSGSDQNSTTADVLVYLQLVGLFTDQCPISSRIQFGNLPCLALLPSPFSLLLTHQLPVPSLVPPPSPPPPPPPIPPPLPPPPPFSPTCQPNLLSFRTGILTRISVASFFTSVLIARSLDSAIHTLLILLLPYLYL